LKISSESACIIKALPDSFIWFHQLSGVDPNKIPPDYFLGNMFSKEVRQCECLKEGFVQHECGQEQRGEAKSYKIVAQIVQSKLAVLRIQHNQKVLGHRGQMSARVGKGNGKCRTKQDGRDTQPGIPSGQCWA